MASPRDVTRVLGIVSRVQRLSVKRAAADLAMDILLRDARQILIDVDARETRRDPSKRNVGVVKYTGAKVPIVSRKPASREQRRAAHARRNAR